MVISFNSLLLTTFLLAVNKLAADPEVQTTVGKIRGTQEEVNGVLVNSYLGIPFAKPPVGDLRFKPPVPIEPWDDTLEAKSMAFSCPHILYDMFPNNRGESMWNSKTELREDCLYLNVWLPNGLKPREPLTTMIWIFGGGFVSGTPALDLYEGKYLAARNDVIVFSINYRLGPLGFIYFGDLNAQGNMGLLDQNLALKWIYDNIETFGGSKQKICLFGESSGAASIHYHMLSPLSWPYFSSVIMQSASALSDWAYQSQSEILSNSIKLAKKVGCYNSTDTTDVVKCLQTIPADLLTTEQWFLEFDSPTFTTFPFVPTTDGFFLTDTPLNLLLKRKYSKVPMLLGVTKNEATFFLLYDLVQAASINNSVSPETALPYIPSEVTKRSNFIRYIPRLIDMNMKPVVLKSILHEYENSSPSAPKQQNIDIIDSIGGDYAFKCPTISVAKEAALDKTRTPSQSVYLYSFEHRTCTNPWPAWTGVLHGDEIEYFFGMPLKEGTSFTKDEKELAANIMDYMTNFAKTGNPNTDNLEKEDTLMNRLLQGRIQKSFASSDIMNPEGPAVQSNDDNLSDQLPPDDVDPSLENQSLPVLEVHKPVPSNTVLWPRYTALDEKYIIFGDGQSITTSSGLKHRECMFWGRLYPDLKKVSEMTCPGNK